MEHTRVSQTCWRTLELTAFTSMSSLPSSQDMWSLCSCPAHLKEWLACLRPGLSYPTSPKRDFLTCFLGWKHIKDFTQGKHLTVNQKAAANTSQRTVTWGSTSEHTQEKSHFGELLAGTSVAQVMRHLCQKAAVTALNGMMFWEISEGGWLALELVCSRAAFNSGSCPKWQEYLR